MPIKSKAQQKWMFANKPEMAKRWAKETPNIKKLHYIDLGLHEGEIVVGVEKLMDYIMVVTQRGKLICIHEDKSGKNKIKITVQQQDK
jgi:hypothetical protein